MIIGSTYSGSQRLTLMRAPFLNVSYQTPQALVTTLFQLHYLNIFTARDPNVSLLADVMQRTGEAAMAGLRNCADTALRRRAIAEGFDLLHSTEGLTFLAIRAGLHNDPQTKALMRWVILCYGDQADPSLMYDQLPLIPFDDQGDLIFTSSYTFSVSGSQMANVLKYPPFYRWLTLVGEYLLQQQGGREFSALFTDILPLMTAPLSPLALLRSGPTPPLPLANVVAIMHRLYPLSPDDNISGYDAARIDAWRRFLSFNDPRVRIQDAQAANDSLNHLFTKMTDADIEAAPLLSELMNVVNRLTQAPLDLYCGARVCSEVEDRIKMSLEAADLISESALGDDDDQGDDTSTTNTPGDDEDENEGNNPMSSTTPLPSPQINNNSIGETSKAKPSANQMVPEDNSGKTPEELNSDYNYQMAVTTLNSRLKNEPDLSVSLDSRERLESWCRFDLWIYPTALTKKLMNELGLTSFLSSFSK